MHFLVSKPEAFYFCLTIGIFPGECLIFHQIAGLDSHPNAADQLLQKPGTIRLEKGIALEGRLWSWLLSQTNETSNTETLPMEISLLGPEKILSGWLLIKASPITVVYDAEISDGQVVISALEISFNLQQCIYPL
ncbi:hypothetical protein [Pedobacter aquatilis]|uniref:hypothetical protein n=1 Tax=Pedobacter aquatilis TaxID=351343 RepID=UPI00292F17F6|nr:hypothetical protein [Pedobacter aquatilis]